VGRRSEKKERRVKADASHDEEVPEKAMVKEWAIGESIKSNVLREGVNIQGPHLTACSIRNPPFPTGNLCRRRSSISTSLFLFHQEKAGLFFYYLPFSCFTDQTSKKSPLTSRLSRFHLRLNRHHGLGRRCSRHAGFARRRAAQTTQKAEGG